MADDEGPKPIIGSHPDRDGVRIVDPIENGQFALYTDEPVEPEPRGTDEFVFPVTTAAEIEASEIRTPYRVNLFIRERDGTLVAECNDDSDASVPDGEYLLEFTSTRMKLYALVDGAIEARWAGDSTVLELPNELIRVGARSLHDKPAGTVTTTDDPEDLMAAISTFGSALKTTSPERSFPTLRGHPPEIERGQSLNIPTGLERPDTGVAIEVPSDYEYVFPVASLAFYLGATVRPGSEPRLLAGGESFPLTNSDFETAVEQTLKQVFLLDCVTRTEGIYPVRLHEREKLEPNVDFDFAELYELPLAERTAQYLSVPYETVEEQVPWFRLTAHVVPEPKHVTVLSRLADDLALIRSELSPVESHLTDAVTDEIGSIFDSVSPEPETEGVASSTRSTAQGTKTDKVFTLPDVETMEQVYVGEGIPIGAGKYPIETRQQQREYEPKNEANTQVAIVYNDTDLRDDGLQEISFNSQSEHHVEIERYTELSTDELEALLAEEREFVHFIGHVEEEGMRCPDGVLDTRSLSSVGVKFTFLNACHSYAQGQGLVNSGALSGVVTTKLIGDQKAASVGNSLVRLLDHGFSIYSSMRIIDEFSRGISEYVVIGDGTAQISSCESNPDIVFIDGCQENRIIGRYRYFLTNTFGQGSLCHPGMSSVDRFAIHPREIKFKSSKETLMEQVTQRSAPMVVNNNLYWTNNPTEKKEFIESIQQI